MHTERSRSRFIEVSVYNTGLYKDMQSVVSLCYTRKKHFFDRSTDDQLISGATNNLSVLVSAVCPSS